MQNHSLISKGFSELLSALSPFVVRELQASFASQWWTSGVMGKLLDGQKNGLPETGTNEVLAASLDIERCLFLIDAHWAGIFRFKMSKDQRTWINELKGVRNKWAHIGTEDFADDYTIRALDTMALLCNDIDAEKTENIRVLYRQKRYGTANGSGFLTETNTSSLNKSNGVLTEAPLGLQSWRFVMQPHPDVAEGRYKNAEFAADLAQVSRGEGSMEYRDPVEFFSRTYITEGMTGLLVQALKRITGKDGEPVVQLKTAFGGGKTHSMLALYHLLKGGFPLGKVPALKDVLQKAGLSELPTAKVAVLVGTALEPTKSKRISQLPGITVNTLWGEMASQLAIAAQNPKLYDLVKESDKKGVSPGSETLQELFDSCGPCLILIDELVAYARKIYGVNGLPAGSFDNQLSFIQELTEAARASKNSIVVASIPESDIEIGGEAGQKTLETIEHTFGRMESIWKPVAADEGFEIVRRRLFLECKDTAARESVCSKFSEMYCGNTSDFPIETKELDYKQRLIKCYPIHPEVFDRLYEDWATLERFQRTRGVLRLMAAVVHNLWMNNDAGLMIMPSSISLDNPNVRDELTRYLPAAWNGIVDKEVDGKMSIPYQKDKTDTRFGKFLAARRVARTIMLGSAPTVKQQSVRGLEKARIILGVVQPGENIASFKDALANLQTSLSFLYSDASSNRFWYDTRPTLRKTAADRALQQTDDAVVYEIEKRLRKIRNEEPFAGVHICPSSSLDVPDEKEVRLVILRTEDVYLKNNTSNKAIESANEILLNRGTSPRSYRNMLVFVAPDAEYVISLKSIIKEYLAWCSIDNDSDELNLDKAQQKEVLDNKNRCENTISLRINETFCWLLVPSVDTADLKEIQWEYERISGGQESIIKKAASKLVQNESIITRWAPALLLMQLDEKLWKDKPYISIKDLWDYLARYCYLPRLSKYSVLEDAILKGLSSDEYFGIAEGESNGRFLELKFNTPVFEIDFHNILVKAVLAKKQIEKEKSDKNEPVFVKLAETDDLAQIHQTDATLPTLPVAPDKNFSMMAQIDPTRINRDISVIVNEVIHHLQKENNSSVEITLEVHANSETGFSNDTIRTVSENCRTLKIQDYSFRK